MRVEEFKSLLTPVTDFVSSRAVDETLELALFEHFPSDGEWFESVERACHAAIAAGWMCVEGGEGRRFGRVIEPGEDTGGLSVDVVDLRNIVGPHHRHPTGEVCMVMPLDADARFDDSSRGWCVYPPGSAHRPTVTDGEALVLYMLPDGRIEFTGN
ncbi:MAG: DUF4863 family protein [Proteobacteria bacterium]|nr:MAG: DUF4863 family protein [Pseudomonadota bacterium]